MQYLTSSGCTIPLLKENGIEIGVLWRVIVPFNSAAVSTFTGFLFASGIIPFLKDESFENAFALLGFGFIFGYFSDNILASMQNLAQRIFGTLNDE